MYGYHNGLTRAAPGVVAVVGLAVRPQAGLVLPGGLRRRHVGARSTTPATSSSGGWASRRWCSSSGRPSRGAASRWPSSPSASRCQWLPWARIDRAAFQYHYYTALPFLFLALAYFLAELWHGASRRTWLLARLAAAVAVIGPAAAVAVLDRPLCAFVGVESVNPGSQACPAVIPDVVLTARTARSPSRWSSASACSSCSAQFLELDAATDRATPDRRRSASCRWP